MNKIYFTWKDFDRAIETLAEKLPKDFDRICGIPRGGLVVAVALSHATGKPLTLFLENPNLLLVDDISDSGKTLGYYSKDAKYTATIHIVRDTQFIPTTWVLEKPKDTWVVYPWEKEEYE